MAASVSCAVVVNIEIILFTVVLKPSTTYFPCPCVPTPRSIIMLYAWDKIYNTYNAVVHLHCSAHTYVFYHIVLLFVINNVLFCISSIISLLCASVAAEYFLLSSDKNGWNTAWGDIASDVNYESDWLESLKNSYTIL